GECERDASPDPDHGCLLDPELHGDRVGGPEADAADVPSQAIRILGHDLHGIGAIRLEDPHRSRCADAVTVQEDHNFANDLLFRPGGSDAAGSDSADASDLTQALGLCLDRVEHLFTEGTHQLFGVDWSNA